ncbi:MAG: S-layer homology domain-containing protein, partial [Clostridia bacterium]|nr:S-layer homology domain-containing protein [Clostridia bacterium]
MKRFLSILLCALMIAALGAPALALPYARTTEELETMEAMMRADMLNRLGLFRGKPEGFALEDGVTRAQAITMLVRFLGAEGEAMLSSVGSPFTDVPQSHWAVAYTTYAKLHGITEGTSETTFSPEDPVTGPQLAKLILSALGYEGVTLQNVYAKGIGAQLLVNRPLKNAVLNDKKLTRADLVGFFHAALLAKTAGGGLASETRIESGVFTQDEFDTVLTAEYNGTAEP